MLRTAVAAFWLLASAMPAVCTGADVDAIGGAAHTRWIPNLQHGGGRTPECSGG